MPRGKDQLQQAMGRYSIRKQDVIERFSGQLGITTKSVRTVEVSNRPGFVWVRLRNVENEVIQAYNEKVSPIYDLPVIVERDKNHPTRYIIVGRDIERYSNWPTESAYLPRHGQQHSFNKEDSGTGGDIVWAYQEQFLPLLVSPSGTYGAGNVLVFPGLYVYNNQFKYAGNTGTADLIPYKPTGSNNASILLLSLEHETGNFVITQGNEFSNAITGTAQVISYLPAPPDGTSPLAGIRLVSGTSTIMWDNIYDVRSFNGYSLINQSGADILAGYGLIASGTSINLGIPGTITELTGNNVTPISHTHQFDVSELTVDNIIVENTNAKIGVEIRGIPGQTLPGLRAKPADFGNTAYAGFTNHNALFLGAYLDQTLSAATQIDSDYPSYIKVLGNGGAVTLTSNPQITAGYIDGQILLIQGISNTNTVTISNGNGLVLKSKVYTLYNQDWIMLMWDADNSVWTEINRSSPTKEQTWAIQSFHYSGSAGSLGQSYAMGFYRHAQGASSFNPAKTFGYDLTAHGSKAYIVLGQDAVDAITIRVSGDQVQEDGSVTAAQAEDIVVPATASRNDYFQTTHSWVGTITFTHLSGTERPFNYGLVKAWNSFDDVYRVTGLNATWFSRVSDDNIDMRLYHHTSTGWSSNTGSNGTASNTNIIASLKTDYGSDDKTYLNEYNSWYRNNLSTLISGSAEGLILMLRSENQNTFLLGNFTLRYRPAW